jgi:hypothetical protein
MVVHPFARAREVLRFYSDFSRPIPDELNTICALLTSPDGEPVVAIAVCYTGSLDRGEEVLRPPREFGPPIYVNAVGMDSMQGVRAAYRATAFERLARLKDTYDPMNLFRLNPNIEPRV